VEFQPPSRRDSLNAPSLDSASSNPKIAYLGAGARHQPRARRWHTSTWGWPRLRATAGRTIKRVFPYAGNRRVWSSPKGPCLMGLLPAAPSARKAGPPEHRRRTSAKTNGQRPGGWPAQADGTYTAHVRHRVMAIRLGPHTRHPRLKARPGVPGE